MQQRARDRIYLFITVFCLLMCAFLLVSVFLDIPIATVSYTREAHAPFMPVVVNTAEVDAAAPEQTDEGIRITSEYLTEQMQSFVPQGFPISGIKAEILGNGSFGLSLEVKKSGLKGFLESGGVKLGLRQSIALGLLPDKLSIEAVLMCVKADKSGASLELEALRINDKNVNTDFLPPAFFEVLSGAINATMAYNGLDWSNVIFSDGALYFGAGS